MTLQLRGDWDIMLNAVVQDRYLPHVRGLRGLWAYTALGKLVWGSPSTNFYTPITPIHVVDILYLSTLHVYRENAQSDKVILGISLPH